MFTDYSEMRDKGLSKFQSIAIAPFKKLVIDLGVYAALVKGTAILFGKIGAGIGELQEF